MFTRSLLAVVVLSALSVVVSATANNEGVEVSGVRAPVGGAASGPDAGSEVPTARPRGDTVAAGLRDTPALPPAQGLDDLARAEARRDALTPVSISIERLGLENTRVKAEGVEPDGAMSVPPALEIGWYKFGPAPGEPGSAVFAGHVAFDGVDGAFRHLDEMEIGDRIVVARLDTTAATFVVSNLTQVAKQRLPFDELFARSGPARVALITCGGEFDYDSRSYSDNVVVIADLVEDS